MKPRLTLSLLLLLFHFKTLTAFFQISVPPFNISHILYPKIHEEFRPRPSLFIKEVLERIAEAEKWKLEDFRVPNLEKTKVKYGTSQRYDILISIGKSKLVYKVWDEVPRWNRFKKAGDFESLSNKISHKALLDVLQIEGPFELRVGGDDDLSLMLPLNSSHNGIKRVLVGEGITVEVRNAQAISLFHKSDFGIESNKSFTPKFESVGYSSCMPLLPINILGSASLLAYKSRNPSAPIEYVFPLKETIELLPEKCYTRRTYKKRHLPIKSLRSRIALLEKILRGILGNRSNNGFVKAKISAHNAIRFQLEIERDIKSNDTLWTTLADWRTRPSVETVLFDVVARIGKDGLKPVMIKKTIPFVGVDSSAWSSLMSNISFTQFPSLLLPPESLTLDVRW